MDRITSLGWSLKTVRHAAALFVPAAPPPLLPEYEKLAQQRKWILKLVNMQVCTGPTPN